MTLRWRLILNNKKLTLIILLVPIILSIGIGTVFRDYSAIDEIPIAVIDQDQSGQSEILIQKLLKLDTLDVQRLSIKDANQLLNDSRIEAVFTILEGYEDMILSGEVDDSIEIKFLESNLVAGALGDIVAREVIKDLVVFSAGNKAERLLKSEQAKVIAMEKANAFMEDNQFELRMNQTLRLPSADTTSESPQHTQNAQTSMGNRIVLGMTLASTAFFMIFIGASIIEEKRQAAFDRLKSAGQPRLTGAYVGFLTFGLVLICIQMGIISTILTLFTLVQVPYLILVFTAFISSISGLMLLASTYFHKSSVFQSLAAPAIFFMCLAGGAFWSLELIPSQLKFISQLSPVYWVMEALVSLSFNTFPNTIPLIVLILVGPAASIVAEQRV